MSRSNGRVVRRRTSIEAVTSFVGHELRNPIAAAMLHAHTLADDLASSGSEAARAAVRIIANELRRLDVIIARMTELQISGRAWLQSRFVELRSVIPEAIERVLASAPRREIVVEQPDAIWGWWDDTAVAEILENLLSNALKFGSGRPVRLALAATKSGVRITVRDHGRGIAARHRGRLFRLGTRVPPGEGGGLGLGLWLVRTLARAHGGGVSVRSIAGHGAVFVVTLRQLASRSLPLGATTGPIARQTSDSQRPLLP